MKLLIIRHGESAPSSLGDFHRSLTPEGADRLRDLGLALQDSVEHPLLLLASPLKRAQESAEILQQAWGAGLEMVPWLAPGFALSESIEQLRLRKEPSLGVVGHLPSVGLLVAYLTEGLPPQEFGMAPGTIVALDLAGWNPGDGKLMWIQMPSHD